MQGRKTEKFRLQIQEDLMFPFKSKGRKKPTFQSKAITGKEKFSPTHGKGRVLCSIQAFNWLDEAYPMRATCFTQSTDLNVNLIQNTLTKTSRMMFDQVSGNPMAQSS